MRYLLALGLVFTVGQAHASRSVMEALPTTFNAVTIGTTTPQLLVNTTFYSGVIPTVSLKASSNVVVGADKCVIYSTGSIGCVGTISGSNTTSISGLTTGRLTKAASATSISDSLIYEGASGETVVGSMTVTGAASLNSATFRTMLLSTGGITNIAGSTTTLSGTNYALCFIGSTITWGACSSGLADIYFQGDFETNAGPDGGAVSFQVNGGYVSPFSATANTRVAALSLIQNANVGFPFNFHYLIPVNSGSSNSACLVARAVNGGTFKFSTDTVNMFWAACHP